VSGESNGIKVGKGQRNPEVFAKERRMPVTSPTYQLSDDQYAQIEDLLPKNGQRGGQW